MQLVRDRVLHEQGADMMCLGLRGESRKEFLERPSDIDNLGVFSFSYTARSDTIRLNHTGEIYLPMPTLHTELGAMRSNFAVAVAEAIGCDEPALRRLLNDAGADPPFDEHATNPRQAVSRPAIAALTHREAMSVGTPLSCCCLKGRHHLFGADAQPRRCP